VQYQVPLLRLDEASVDELLPQRDAERVEPSCGVVGPGVENGGFGEAGEGGEAKEGDG